MKEKEKDTFDELAVDGQTYVWRVRHGSLRDADVGLKGLSVSVWLTPERTRELIVDFPFSGFGRDKAPKRLALLAALQPAVRAAIVAGWDPESRGRAFRFNVPDPQEAP